MANKLPGRSQPLGAKEERHILDWAIPDRIRMIENCLTHHSSYAHLTAAAIHARALAGFLGIGADRTSIWADPDYHNHGGNVSFEVKISDITKGVLYDLAALKALSASDQEALRVGFDTTNRELAHFTFWSDPTHQAAGGAPKDSYFDDLKGRVSRFCHVVLRLLRQRLHGL